MNFKNILMVGIVFTGMTMADTGTELSPLVGLDITCHRCLEDTKGLNINFEIGIEGLITLGDNFGAGLQVKSSIGYDFYNEIIDEGSLFDEYFPITMSIGPVFYIGNYWYIGGGITKVVSVIGHDTWVSADGEDLDVKDRKYKVDKFDYELETGFRVSFHNAIYMKVNTNLISSYTIDRSKYNVYFGWRYFI